MKKLLLLLLILGTITPVFSLTQPHWLQIKAKPFVDVKSYGVKGNGTTNDTDNIQAALNAAVGNNVLFPPGSYSYTMLTIPAGVKGIYGYGATLVSTQATTATASITFADAASGISFEGFTIDNTTVGVYSAIYLSNATSNKLKDLTITGEYIVSSIWLDAGCNGNTISNCNITGGTVHHRRGVYLSGTVVDSYGGYMDGAFVEANPACIRNLISENYLVSLDFPIMMSGANNNVVTGNIIDNSSERAIILSPVCSYNTVSNNTIRNNTSSGIHLAYGSNKNLITGNKVETITAQTGEHMMGCYVGCEDNLISNNFFSGNTRYGYYCAIGCQRNVFTGNTIRGDMSIAGVALESDWLDVPPASATFSRPNYSAPIAPRTEWPSQSTSNNQVSNNNIQMGLPGIPVFYLSQIASSSLDTNIIKDNVVVDRVVGEGYILYHYGANVASSTGNVYENNTSKASSLATFFYSTFGREPYSRFSNINNNNGSAFVYFPAVNATTISAFYSDVISTAHYTANTTVTDFTGGNPGQVINVQLSNNTTIKYNPLKIRTPLATDTVGSSNSWVRFLRYGGIWYQQ